MYCIYAGTHFYDKLRSMKTNLNKKDVLIHAKEIFEMKKHTFSKKLLSVALSALTAFSAGSAAMTTAFYSAPVVYAASGLSSQDSKLLKAEEKMIMGMAKTVFKDVPFFGNFLDGIDSILDLTGAFGSSGGGGKSVSTEDLEELRNHLDEELTEIKSEISRLGADLTSEIGMSFYAGNLGQELIDLHTTSSLNASNIARYKKSSDYKTENDKLVMVASLIGNTNDWSNNKQNLVYRMHQIGLLLKGTTYSDLDGKSIYQKVYDYYARKSLFSGEIYDKAVPYIDSVVYEYLYAYSVLMECMEASLKVSRFTPEDEAALSAKVSEEYKKLKSNSESVIEDEIGAEALMMFNFHDEKSMISQYSNFIYNAENSRFTYLDKGNTKIAVKPILGSKETGRESDVNEIKVITSGGSNNTRAHEIYNSGIYRYQNALDGIQFISSAKLGEMGTYVSENYQSTKSVWDFLSDRGFDLGVTDSNTNMLVTNAKVKQWEKTNSSNKWGEYNKDQYQGYTGFVYNNESLTPKDVLLYTLNHRKVQDSLAYQAIVYNHYYRSYAPDTIKTKPLKIFYFEQDTFHNVSTFSYDSKINSVIVNAKATGATGRQTVKVQYRQDSDDAWTTSYAPSSVIPLGSGYTYEFRTVISDEAGHKETTDTFYVESPTFVEAKEPYIDSDGDYHLGNVAYFSNKGKYYAVNEDGTMGKELSDVTVSCFEFLPLDDGTYQISYYTGSYDKLENDELVLPKTFNGKRITVIGTGIGTGKLDNTCLFMSKATGRRKKFTLVLNENIRVIRQWAFYGAYVIKVTGNTSGLCKLGMCSLGYLTYSLDITLDYPGQIETEEGCFYHEKVTIHLRHTTTFSNNNLTDKTVTYDFTDAHLYGEPTWSWSDDHSSAKATFICADTRCGHKETVDAVVTKVSSITYKASVEFEGKTYTDTYTVPHTHTYSEPVWNWSESFSKASAAFTCVEGDDTRTLDAEVTKNEENGKTVYTARVEFGGKTYTDTVKPLHNTSALSAERIGADDTVTINCSSEDGSGKVLYTVSYKKGKASSFSYWYSLQEGSENTTLQFRPKDLPRLETNGIYTIKVEASNTLSDGSRYTDTKTVVLYVGDPFRNTSDIYHKLCNTGSTVYVTCSTQGGMCSSADVLFSVYYKLSSSEEWTTIAKWSRMSSQMSFVPKTAGRYDVRVEATDVSTNETIVKDITIYAVAPLVNTSTVTAKTVNDPIVVNCSAEGGTGSNYLYTVYYRKYAYTDWNYVQKESENTTVLINPTSVSKYEVMVIAICTVPDVSDKLETLKKFTVSVTKGHTYSEPVWSWSDDHSSAKAVFSCTECDHQEAVDAEVTKTEEDDNVIYTATVTFGGNTYTDTNIEEKPHVHTYGEPVWSWSDDHASAKATFTCTEGDDTQTLDAVVTRTEETDKIIYTAAVEFGGKVYTDTYTEAKEETPVYYPAAKPYIDDEGEYILGYKEHYRYKGKYYAVNSDKSVGEEITDIWISYFRFSLLPDDTYAIEYYTGATKNLTEIVIPKTFNGKKITVLGTDNLDVFIKAGKPQFELVLNENITEIKSCAFNKIGVTKVTGDTSGLNKIGEYAFSWVNKTGGYALDITFAYPGTITTGDAIFNHVNATIRLGHGTTFSNTDFRATSLTYDFNDAHTYGEPTWIWDEDYFFATATFTCTNPGCGHQETIRSKTVETQQPDGQILLSERVTFNGKDYIAPKPVYRTEVGEYIVEITGFYRGYIGNPKDNIEGLNKLTVRFIDKNGNEVTAPTYIWTAKETAAEGIVLESNGDIMFTKGGDFHVQLTSPDGETVYSSWIPILCLFESGDDSEKSSPEIIVPDPDNTPKTGDSTSAAAATAILLTSLTAALLLAMKRRKNEA